MSPNLRFTHVWDEALAAYRQAVVNAPKAKGKHYEGDDWAEWSDQLESLWKAVFEGKEPTYCKNTIDPERPVITYVCTLPIGHSGPCIGNSAEAAHMKDRLSYRGGLYALPVKLYQEEAQS